MPTGIGVGRMLKKDGKISDSWINKIEYFLALKKLKSIDFFYDETNTLTLFGYDDQKLQKKRKRLRKLLNYMTKDLERFSNFYQNHLC